MVFYPEMGIDAIPFVKKILQAIYTNTVLSALLCAL